MGTTALLYAKVQLATLLVTRLVKADPVTLTDAPVPALGTSGAGKLASLEVITILESGMLLAPLVSALLAVARMVICPAFPLTSTGRTTLVGAPMVGKAAFQFTETLLPLAGVLGVAGMEGVRAKETVSMVALAIGYAPVPTRKNRYLSMLVMKSSLALALTGWLGVPAGAAWKP